MSIVESLQEIYPYHSKTGAFVIPVRLKSYDDFFNPIDPSPAPGRDLSQDLLEYLNQCSDEIPEKFPLEISIEITDETEDEHRQTECLGSLRSFFQHEIFVTQAHIRRQRRQALKYLFVSILCLAVYILSEGWSFDLFLWNLLKEAVLIGGWVFMWEAVTINFIEMEPHYREIQKCQRLIKAKMNFTEVR